MVLILVQVFALMKKDGAYLIWICVMKWNKNEIGKHCGFFRLDNMVFGRGEVTGNCRW